MSEEDSRITLIEQGKPGERPSWDEYFMAQAVIASSRASCHNVQAGSVITKNNRIVATGYNGAPPGIQNSLDRGYCTKEQKTGKDFSETMNMGFCIGAHAETNALANVPREDAKDSTIYTTIFPCNGCIKGGILAYGLGRVVYKSAYDPREIEGGLSMLLEAGIEVARLNLTPERFIQIAFGHPARKFSVWSPDDRKVISDILGPEYESR